MRSIKNNDNIQHLIYIKQGDEKLSPYNNTDTNITDDVPKQSSKGFSKIRNQSLQKKTVSISSHSEKYMNEKRQQENLMNTKFRHGIAQVRIDYHLRRRIIFELPSVRTKERTESRLRRNTVNEFRKLKILAKIECRQARHKLMIKNFLSSRAQ